MSSEYFVGIIDQMIIERGDVWLDADDDRNRKEMYDAVVITDHPEHCWRLVYVEGQWQKHKDRLRASELAEFFAAFGSHWSALLNSSINTSSGIAPIRAFIKNGRKRCGFSISIDANNLTQGASGERLK